MRICFCIIVSCSLLSCNAQPAINLKVNNDNNSLLWEISGKGLEKPSYLFGTFHLLCKSDISVSEQLSIALKNSNTVYMELDMDDPATLMGGLLLMNMKGGKKLKDLYSKEEYERVENFFADSLHTPISLMQSMKPFFLMSLIYPKLMNCKSMSGMEEELIKLAKENKKEVMGLETMAFQASIFDSIPYEAQAKELLNIIDSLPENKKEFDIMLQAYKSQQLSELEKSIEKSELGTEFNGNVLLTRRNKNWVEQLNTIMNNESVFVAVGAGHLVGKNGLIDLLKKEGFVLKPLYNR